MHGLGFPRVLFTRPTRLVKTTHRQHVSLTIPTTGMNLFSFGLNTVGANARNAALHPWEILGNHRARQTNSFKI